MQVSRCLLAPPWAFIFGDRCTKTLHLLSWSQDGAEMEPRVSKWSQDVPKWSQDVSKWKQDVPRWSQDGAKMEPRVPKWSQDVPKWSQDVPKWNQDISKWKSPGVSWLLLGVSFLVTVVQKHYI